MPWPKWLGGRGKAPQKKSPNYDRFKKDADGNPWKPGAEMPQSRFGAGASFLGAYALGAWGTPGGSLRGITDRYVPTFSNQVIVRVSCSPRAFMQDAYFLALSAAFGATADLTYVSSNEITVTIDRANKVVEVTLTYESNGLNTGVNAVLSSFIETGKDVISAGVPDTVNGGDWPKWLRRQATGNPDLPLVGKPIATHKITDLGNDRFGANYVPRSDGLSRDNDLTTIVAAALLEGPCSSPAVPFLTDKPTPPPGILVTVPTLGSQAPTKGGLDTNRWTLLAQQGVAAAIPTWTPPNNYQIEGNG